MFERKVRSKETRRLRACGIIYNNGNETWAAGRASDISPNLEKPESSISEIVYEEDIDELEVNERRFSFENYVIMGKPLIITEEQKSTYRSAA